MAKSMSIFEITPERLAPLQSAAFSDHGIFERRDLQRLLRNQVDVIAPDVLVVSEEFGDWEESRRRIDLLGIDKAANLVVIELKRTEDGGHMELQAIRYAAMVSKMTFDKLAEVFQDYLVAQGRQEDARRKLLEHLGWENPDETEFAQDVRIVLASAEFSKELTSAVLWLREHELDIRCVRLRPYTDGAKVFLDVQQILPLPEANDYFVKIREKQAEERAQRSNVWSGLWFVNVGMDDSNHKAVDDAGRSYVRHWQHCATFGYLAAGGGLRWSGALKKLNSGDEVLAYQSGKGYVGYGTVIETARPIHQFALADGRTLAEALNQSNYNDGRSEDEWEYAVGIRWHKQVELSAARTFKGAFASTWVVCKLSDPETVRFLKKEFQIENRTTTEPALP